MHRASSLASCTPLVLLLVIGCAGNVTPLSPSPPTEIGEGPVPPTLPVGSEVPLIPMDPSTPLGADPLPATMEPATSVRPSLTPMTGSVLTVPSGGSIQSVVDQASPGDTVIVEPGTYSEGVRIDKSITLVSRVAHGAVLVGTNTPPTDVNQGESGAKAVGIYVYDSGADGTWIDGFDLRYFSQGIRMMRVQNVRLSHNRFVSNYGNGIVLKDTRAVEVFRNHFLDPYLPSESPLGTVTTDGASDAQSDYGMSIYGSVDTWVHHNSFFGVFNQALSFKYGNVNGRVEDNTFEGCTLTALFFGQEVSLAETYPRFGHEGNDTGTFKAVRNLFRNVKAEHLGATVEYRLRSPIRVYNVDAQATVELAYNVVQSALEGFRVECYAGGCARGSVFVHHNLFSGRVVDSRGVDRTIGDSALWVHAGALATTRFDHNTVVSFTQALDLEGGTVDVTNNIFVSAPGGIQGTARTVSHNTFYRSGTGSGVASSTQDPEFVGPLKFDIVTASEALAPDLGFRCPYALVATSSERSSGENGTYRGALPPDGVCP